jgi:hypothetical protein
VTPCGQLVWSTGFAAPGPGSIGRVRPAAGRRLPQGVKIRSMMRPAADGTMEDFPHRGNVVIARVNHLPRRRLYAEVSNAGWWLRPEITDNEN